MNKKCQLKTKTTQTSGLKRNPTDKFYTKPTTVQLCLKIISENLQINPNTDLIIEPSAGNGAFSIPLQTLYPNLQSYDLLPEHPDIQKQDYLLLDSPNLTTPIKYRKIHVIGNPPFGRQASMAKKFIKHSQTFCDTISFILPKSFKKASFSNVFKKDFHQIISIDLPQNAFTLNGKDYDVPAVFQIWQKDSTIEPRITQNKIEPIGYEFVKKDSSPPPDISIRRVGVNAGTIDAEITTKSPQSHYFIRLNSDTRNQLTKISMNQFLEKYRKEVQFDFNNTVGPKSIAKTELIPKLNKLFK